MEGLVWDFMDSGLIFEIIEQSGGENVHEEALEKYLRFLLQDKKIRGKKAVHLLMFISVCGSHLRIFMGWLIVLASCDNFSNYSKNKEQSKPLSEKVGIIVIINSNIWGNENYFVFLLDIH